MDKSCKKLSGVDCGVVNCKFHSVDNACVADNIKVENHNAMKRAETFCGTFAPRSEFNQQL
ncbi:MAG: DUF1540 domain-containing protein [Oscillospiraceae bacterium]|nr:DUF1540 domain-containing protein [Oscillospiraceae bacterium]